MTMNSFMPAFLQFMMSGGNEVMPLAQQLAGTGAMPPVLPPQAPPPPRPAVPAVNPASAMGSDNSRLAPLLGALGHQRSGGVVPPAPAGEGFQTSASAPQQPQASDRALSALAALGPTTSTAPNVPPPAAPRAAAMNPAFTQALMQAMMASIANPTYRSLGSILGGR